MHNVSILINFPEVVKQISFNLRSQFMLNEILLKRKSRLVAEDYTKAMF